MVSKVNAVERRFISFGGAFLGLATAADWSETDHSGLCDGAVIDGRRRHVSRLRLAPVFAALRLAIVWHTAVNRSAAVRLQGALQRLLHAVRCCLVTRLDVGTVRLSAPWRSLACWTGLALSSYRDVCRLIPYMLGSVKLRSCRTGTRRLRLQWAAAADAHGGFNFRKSLDLFVQL